MFCAPRLVFGAAEGVGSRFHVLHSRTPFRRYRWRRVPFSYFARPNSFSTAPGASCPVFMFCAPRLVFGGTEGVGSRFHILRSGLIFGGTDGVGSRFHILRSGLIFGGTEGIGSRFHVLRAQSHFRWYQGRRVPFSCFALPDLFSAVHRASGTVLMYCTPGHVFGGT
jgi:hypothetical protein